MELTARPLKDQLSISKGMIPLQGL